MEKNEESRNVNRIQKDYTKSFKVQVVEEIEQGRISTYEICLKYGIQSSSTVYGWLREFGHFDWDNQSTSETPKAIEQKILELEAKVKLLEKHKTFLET
ncbi:COG2963 Transposase and inactivated derivatives [Flavobacteriaceae bacterium]